LITVTHDRAVANRADRRLRLERGRLVDLAETSAEGFV